MSVDNLGGVIVMFLAITTAIAAIGATLFFASDILERWLNTGDDRAVAHRDESMP